MACKWRYLRCRSCIMAAKGGNDGFDSGLRKLFDIQRCVGKGAYGIVWKVTEKESGRTMAVKRCFDAFVNSTDAQRTFREIIFLEALNGHENIVRLMNVIKAENPHDLYLVFDYMESDLQHVIAASMLQLVQIEYITYQVLKALKYVHSGGVLHRDLKPSNVLLNRNCHVRLCDFGLARTSSLPGGRADGACLLTDYVATRWYRAPELLLGATAYAESVDMWSLGCILGDMINEKPIFRGRSTLDQLIKIMELTGKPSEADVRPILANAPYAKTMLESIGRPSLPTTSVLFLAKAPTPAKDLIVKLLKFNPEKRLSAEAALEDRFVQRFHRQEAEPTCDKIIRMPIADTTKMKAADYRECIGKLIRRRERMAKEEMELSARVEVKSSASQGPVARSSTPSPRVAPYFSDASSDHVPMQTPWQHEGGAAAPPTTPR